MFERYTDHAQRVIFFARYEVSERGSSSIEPEHLLLGLFREDRALIAGFLPDNVSTEMIRQQVEASLTKGERIPTSIEIPLSRMSELVLEYAQEESNNLKHGQVSTEHLLLGLLRHQSSGFQDKESIAERILRENGFELAEVRQRIKSKTEKN
ncbi:MAG: Clp protease N-terminal domain-containing protein [Acidobacteriota bacterium]